MNKVIITGAYGFVGSNTVQYFLAQGVEVLALDIGAALKRLQLQEGLHYMQCDVSDTENMLKKIPHDVYDTFIHFAWPGSAGPDRANYNLQMKNALDTVECVKSASALGCVRFVCAGSIMEYEVEAAVHAQGNRPGMGYIYGMGKHIAHCMSKAVAAESSIELVWPMITNAYGVGERSPRMVNTTIQKCLRGESPRFTAGTQNYDFVYIDDVARAFYLIAKKGKPFCEYLIGSSAARPLREFLLEMKASVAPDLDFVFGDVPFSGVNMPLSAFDCRRTENDTGFRAQISFAEGCKRTADWWKEIINK